MKITNIISRIFLIILTFAFVSCEDDITREPSPEVNPNNTNVYFLNTNDINPVLAIDQTSFDVVLGRKKTNTEQVVGLTSESVYEGLFEIPKSVTFKNGEAETTLTIKIKDLELMKKYHIAINVEFAQTEAYLIQDDEYPRLELNVLQEDFAPYASGTYNSVFFGDSWDAVLEYSPATDLYRFTDCWVSGYDVLFGWNKETNEVSIQGTVNSAKTFVYLQTGYLHPTYGMVSAYYDLADTKYYNPVNKTFTFPITWRVSAGSFGVRLDSFTIEQEL